MKTNVNILGVHRKIKELTRRLIKARPLIRVNRLAKELGLEKETLMPRLISLEEFGLIRFSDATHSAFSLTDHGDMLDFSETA